MMQYVSATGVVVGVVVIGVVGVVGVVVVVVVVAGRVGVVVSSDGHISSVTHIPEVVR